MVPVGRCWAMVLWAVLLCDIVVRVKLGGVLMMVLVVSPVQQGCCMLLRAGLTWGDRKAEMAMTCVTLPHGQKAALKRPWCLRVNGLL